ncbi:MAG: 3'-5' exonuclease [Betaproteobacteria bacterium]|nr:3'-5' exonuclease [Betaproteobacteria bacterium]
MTPTLVFDLETIPDVSGLRRLGLIQPDGSEADGVAGLMAEREAAGQSTFLPHHLHRVWIVGCAFRDADGFRVRCLGDGYGVTDADEATRIRQFFGIIERHTPQLVSWNGSGFDGPVLHYRSMVHGLAAPIYWDQGDLNRDFKYNNYLSRYHHRHLDLMDVLANFTGRANAPLDAMSQLCGLPGKLGEDGAKVWDAYLEGRAESVAAYCETDVVNTYLLYLRFRLMRGELSATSHQQECDLVRESLSKLVGDAKSPLQGAHWQKFLAAWSDQKVS